VDGATSQSESTEAIRNIVADVTKRYDRSYWLDCVKDARPPHELQLALAKADLLGLGVPAEMGGIGGGMRDQCTMIEYLGRAGIPGYLLIIQNFARNAVLHHGSAEQIETFVRPTMSGEQITAFALTEPDAGTNTFAMTTTATRDGDDWLVNGTKVFISGALDASQMLLVARTSPLDPARKTFGLSMFIVDMKAPGITMHPQRIRATEPEKQCILHFDDLRLPASALVGEADKGFNYLFDALNPERVLSAAMAVGLGSFVLEKGVEYAKTRAPFGKPIGAYQAVQHPLARAYVNLEASKLMTYQAADAIDNGEDAGILSNGAKLIASEAAGAALDAALQVHGGYAIDYDYDIISLYEVLRLLRIAPINNEMVLNYLAERALGLPRSS
jgi:acyl-CoA dehydrogenase